jgi:hypothetical protein
MNSREVRLILIENVSGISMQNLNPSNFTKSERQGIMKAIIDSETALYNREIVHRDIYPRSKSRPCGLRKSADQSLPVPGVGGEVPSWCSNLADTALDPAAGMF